MIWWKRLSLMDPGWPIMKSHMFLNITGLFSWASCSVVMACLDVKCIPHRFVLILTVSGATIAFLVNLRWSKHLNESFPSAGMPHKWCYCFWNPYEHLCTSNNCINFIGSELVPGLVFLREGHVAYGKANYEITLMSNTENFMAAHFS